MGNRRRNSKGKWERMSGKVVGREVVTELEKGMWNGHNMEKRMGNRGNLSLNIYSILINRPCGYLKGQVASNHAGLSCLCKLAGNNSCSYRAGTV